MNNQELQNYMKQHKSTLKILFKAKTNQQKKNILLNLSLIEVNVIFHILFYITQGVIPIKKHNYQILEKSKKLALLYRFFENDLILEKNLALPLKEKIGLLLKFVPVYETLFHPIFKR